MCDNGVPSKCDTATVNVRVNEPVAGNQPPIAVDDAKLTNVNTAVSGTVAANDYDPDNNVPLSYAKVTNWSDGDGDAEHGWDIYVHPDEWIHRQR